MAISLNLRQLQKLQLSCCRAVSFFSRKKTEIEPEEKVEKRKMKVDDRNSKHALNLLAAKASLTTKRAYDPPSDVESKLENIVKREVPNLQGDWRTVSLQDPLIKYKIASKATYEFNHDLPNNTLSEIGQVSDLVDFYSTPVRQTSAFEDMAKLDLPPNMHIVQEYTRYDPDADTLFGGKSAFPGQDTVVTSIKYKRKYKGIRNKKDKAGYVDFYNLGY